VVRGDAALDHAWDEARSQSRTAQAHFGREQQTISAENPERVKRLAVNAEQTLDQARRRLRELQDEQRQVAGRLEAKGERGLFEALEEARTVHERAAHENHAVGRRAAASKLLFDTMAMERENARRAYAAPLRKKIITLGRLVFDETFDVDLAEDLSVRARTLGGRTLPFGDLSVGAQEQLSLIHRVACALLVDDVDGVPLVFDDTLGHSDPERLEGMGAMLARAGERCQIIVLTCTPGRFRHVGGANFVRL